MMSLDVSAEQVKHHSYSYHALAARSNVKTSLHLAAKRGLAESFQQDLARGLLNTRDHQGKTALFVAAQHGRASIVNHLLDHDADLELPTVKGKTPIYAASKKGHLSVVSLLIRSGCNVNHGATPTGQTPLMVASKHGHLRIVTQLLLAKANVSTYDLFGRTAISIAVLHGHVEIVQELLEMGASVDTSDSMGRRPVDIARENK